LLLRWDRVLGLDLGRETAPREPELPSGAQALIDRRERARAAKDYAEADALRGELGAMGVDVEDTAAGPKPRVARRPTP
jgi:cysteinyl-tRNA synthetase